MRLFRFKFLALISTLLKWQIQVNFPTESWGPHPSSDSEKKLNFSMCVYVLQTTSQKEIQRRVHTGCKEKRAARAKLFLFIHLLASFPLMFSLLLLLLLLSPLPQPLPSPVRLCSQDLSMCVNGQKSEYIFGKNTCQLFTRYIFHSRFGPLVNYFVSLHWKPAFGQRGKRSPLCKKIYIYFKVKNRVCSQNNYLQIFCFLCRITVFLLLIHSISFLCTTFSGTHVRTVRTGSYSPGDLSSLVCNCFAIN